MKHFAMALCALFIACDDSGNDGGEMVDGDGSLGVAVSELDKWGLESCPAGLEEVDGLCVAGTVDMQLDVDDCVVISKCLPNRHSCASAAVVAILDDVADMPIPSLEWTRENNETAARLIYQTWENRGGNVFDEKGLEYIAGAVSDWDKDGTSECLIALEADIIQDHWRWSKVRESQASPVR